MHFAAFHGNMKAIKYLVENGADIFMNNYHRMNMLHVAAQGNSPSALYYFYKAGLDINAEDKRQGTPLHWAAY